MNEKRYSFFIFRLYHRNEETLIIEMLLLRSKKPTHISILTILLCCFAFFFQCRHEVIAQVGNVSLSAHAGFAFWTQNIVINRLSNVQIPTNVSNSTSSPPIEQFVQLGISTELNERFRLSLGTSFGITNFSANGNESSTFAVNGRPVEGIIQHTTDSYLSGMTLIPSFSAKVFQSFYAGIEVPYYIPFYSYSRHSQEIIQPTELKGSQLSNEFEELPTRESFGSWLALGFFARYSLPINSSRTLTLNPSISFRKMLQSPILSNSILPTTFNAAVGVEYVFRKNIRQQYFDSVITKNDTVLVLGTVLSRDTVTFIEQTVDSVKDIIIENASIKRTYVHNTYKHTVPKKTPVLTGQIRATFYDENNDAAHEMSEDVSLTEIYDIARCTIWSSEKSGLDSIPQFMVNKSLIKENKTEKIKSTTLIDTLNLIYPSTIRLRHNAVSEAGLQSWKIHLEQNSTLVKEISGTNELAEYTDININELNIYKTGAELICKLVLRDYEGNEFTTQNTRIKLLLGANEHNDSSHNVEIYFVDEKINKKKYKDFLSEEVANSLLRVNDMKTKYNQDSETPILRFRKLQWLNRFSFLHKYMFSLQVIP